MVIHLATDQRWSDLSLATKVRFVVLGLIQVGLMVAALWDIRRRPQEEINGSKAMWTLLAFVNWVGPILYFWKGRKDPAMVQ